MQYPQIIRVQQETNKTILQLNISSDLIYFQGHFEEFNLLPGVVQLGWAILFAKTYLNFKQDLNSLCIENIKFTHIIRPSDDISLELLRKGDYLYFYYRKDAIVLSSGKLKWGETA